MSLKLGVQATYPLALDVKPAQIARTQSPNAVPYFNEQGLEVIYQSPWKVEPGTVINPVPPVHPAYHEWGNEPKVEDWPAYRQSLREASPILRAAGRKVVLAAASSKHTEEWLTASNLGKVMGCVDGVAVHPYEPTPQGVLEHVRMARDIIPKRLPLIITEFGWSADGRGHKSPMVAYDEKNQARLLAATFQLLRRNAKALNLHAALWFCWQDYEADHWWSGNGLHRLDGSERPAMDAFREACK